MTFLNPLILFGLAAAAIPVILHLMNLRKLRTIEFSSLAFLKELQQTRIRRLKLRQLIILIVRTLLVITVVLAFARPALRGSFAGGPGSRAHSTMVIILDDSFSMTASDDHGEYFKQARESALRLLDLVQEGDEVILLKLSDLPNATIAPATHDAAMVRTVISEAQVSAVRRSVTDAASLAENLLRQSHNPNKEVYLLSDMQETLFTLPPKGSEKMFDTPVTFTAIAIGSGNVSNAGIDSVDINTAILEKNKPVTLRTLVRNFGPAPLTNYVISAYLDGVKAAQRTVSVEPWGSATADVLVIPKRTGLVSGFVALEDDPIAPDNKRYFSIRIPETISVGIFAGSSSDAEYLKLALGADAGDEAHSLFTITEIPASRLPYTDLSPFDVIISVNVPSFSTADAERIRDYVDRGGGLLLFPGPSVNITDYNSTFLPLLHVPPVPGSVRSSGAQNPALFSHVDPDHPLFATMFEKERQDKREATILNGTPHVLTWLAMQTGKQGRTIITLNDGSAFLSELRIGTGRILLYSTSPILSWSDFPLKGLFAPLVHRSVVYASPRDERQSSFMAGDSPEIRLRSTPKTRSGEGRYSILLPDGSEDLIQPSAGTSVTRGMTPWLVFRIPPLRDPGMYQIRKGTMPLEMIATNVDRLESDLRPVTDKTARSFWTIFGIDPSTVRHLAPDDRLQTAILQTRYGLELWRYLIVMALLLAAVEMLIARDSRKALQQALPA